jgi:hypothetical protein
VFSKTKFNFWLDVVLFVAFLVTVITGLLVWLVIPSGPAGRTFILLGMARHIWIDIHSWFGVGMLAGVALHLILHYKWIGCVAERFFEKLARQARVNFSLDSVLFVVFFLTSLSGLIVWLALPSGGYRGGRNPFFNATLLGLTRYAWSDLHLWTGLAMLAVVTVHLALHLKWIVCVVRRYAQAAVCNLARNTSVEWV